jgi:RHS repeat-associated protein
MYWLAIRPLPANSRTTNEGPFGEVIRSTGPLAKVNPIRFSTKHQDDESDLLYYGYRYYKASTGTWASRDPVKEKGGRNLYAFVANSPITSIDKNGHIQIKNILGHPTQCGGYIATWLLGEEPNEVGGDYWLVQEVLQTSIYTPCYLSVPLAGIDHWFEAYDWDPKTIAGFDHDNVDPLPYTYGGVRMTFGFYKLLEKTDAITKNILSWDNSSTIPCSAPHKTRALPPFWDTSTPSSTASRLSLIAGWNCCCGNKDPGQYAHFP